MKMRLKQFIHMANKLGGIGMGHTTTVYDPEQLSSLGKTKVFLYCTVGVGFEMDNEILAVMLKQGSGAALKHLSDN